MPDAVTEADGGSLIMSPEFGATAVRFYANVQRVADALGLTPIQGYSPLAVRGQNEQWYDMSDILAGLLERINRMGSA